MIGCFIVDVDRARRAEMRRRLNAVGVCVVELPSVQIAIATMRGIAPDAVIVDMEQPALQVAQLARAVRGFPATRHAALIAVADGHSEARAAGYDVLVARGFQTIGAEVRRCVGRGPLRLVRSPFALPEPT